MPTDAGGVAGARDLPQRGGRATRVAVGAVQRLVGVALHSTDQEHEARGDPWHQVGEIGRGQVIGEDHAGRGLRRDRRDPADRFRREVEERPRLSRCPRLCQRSDLEAPFRQRESKRRPCEGARRGFSARLRSAYASAGIGGALPRGCASSTATERAAGQRDSSLGRALLRQLWRRDPRASPPLPPVTSAPQDLRDVSAVMPVPRLAGRPRAAARWLGAATAKCASARGPCGRLSPTA
jgi:hypothetical protein